MVGQLKLGDYHPAMELDPKSLEIVCFPDPILRKVAKPIEQITDHVHAVAMRMLELMHEAPGVGLAAPQVGLPWRLFVANPTREEGQDSVFINPVLTNPSSQMAEVEEGCLSLPQVTANIRRPAAISIETLNLKGQTVQHHSEELAARVWQHENDHLDGVLILDRMSPIDKLANRSVIRELKRIATNRSGSSLRSRIPR